MENAAQLSPMLQQRFKLGLQQLQGGQWADGESTYRQILKESTGNPDVHHNLAIALKNQGKLREAMEALRTALTLRPGFAEAFNTLGQTLGEMNQPDKAKEAYRWALELRPNFPEVHHNVAGLMERLHRPTAAIESFKRALALRPDFAEDWNNLGIVLRQTYQRVEAVEAFRRAAALWGNCAPVWNNLAGSLRDIGQIDAALACFDRAIAIEPNGVAAYSNRLNTLQYHPGFDAQAIFQEARRWNQLFSLPFAGEIPVHDNDPGPQRRLRIGYVSADFREHCVAMFVMPLFAHHDHGAVEIFCYSNFSVPDAVTASLRGLADVCRVISSLTDQAVAQIIRQEMIDILMDLALHSAGNRLGIFARKPAPIQVTWLGYPGTTGLDTMDYRLTDSCLDPSVQRIQNRQRTFLFGAINSPARFLLVL